MNKVRSLRLCAAIGILFLIGSSPKETFASHAIGADLTYQCIGGNIYRFHYTLYRDCIGISPALSYSFSGISVCGGSYNFVVNLDSSAEISRTCPAAVTVCVNPATWIMGVEAYYYHADVPASALPPCTEWIFGYAECCRNAGITNIQTPSSFNLYVETTLNNVTAPCNNSPVFTNHPVIFMCAGPTQYFNHGAFDIDGDSLAFELVTPLSASGTPVIYNAGVSATQPVTYAVPADSTLFNSQTGDIQMKPDASQITVMAVKVYEYRNGVLIGTVIRDMQIIVEFCTDQLPDLTGIGFPPNYFTANICAGVAICFTIFTTDADAPDSTFLSCIQGIPGAIFTTSHTMRDTGYFCWTPTLADTANNPHIMVLSVRDDACPVFQTTTKSYSFYVRSVHADAGPDQSTDCSGMVDLQQNAATGDVTLGDVLYSWIPGGVTNAISPPAWNGVGAGTYGAVATLTIPNGPFYSSFGTTCMDTDYVSVTDTSAGFIDMQLTASATGACDSIISFTSQLLVASGDSITAIHWDFGDAGTTSDTSNLQNPTYAFPSSGTYQVILSAWSAGGCYADTFIFVTIFSPPVVSLGNDTLICNTDSMVLDAGSGFISYLWNDNTTNQTITAVAQTTGVDTISYFVTVTDSNLCTGSDTITVIFENCTGLSEFAAASTCSVFPNPTESSVTLSVGNFKKSEDYLFVIFDATGREVFRRKISREKEIMDLTSLSKGFYQYKFLGRQEFIQGGKLILK